MICLLLLRSFPAIQTSTSPSIKSPPQLSPFSIDSIPFQLSISEFARSTESLRESDMEGHPEFEDMLPVMAERLGGEALIGELCKGFRLLMDRERGVITFESLKRNAPLLGLDGMSDADLRSMLDAGDFDGDGVLSEMEFCVLMFRMSPELMERSEDLLDEAFQGEPAGVDEQFPFFQFL